MQVAASNANSSACKPPPFLLPDAKPLLNKREREREIWRYVENKAGTQAQIRRATNRRKVMGGQVDALEQGERWPRLDESACAAPPGKSQPRTTPASRLALVRRAQ
jgi:hypothetical protein